MRTAIYCRVSGSEQAEKGSIDTQVQYLERHCAAHHLEIVEVYKDEGVSGTLPFESRPEGGRLIRDARRGRFDLVLSFKLDRIGRGAKVIYDAITLLEGTGIGYVSATENFDSTQATGKLMFWLLVTFAGFECEVTRERSHEGRKRSARNGKWPGGPTPIGYKLDSDGYLTPQEEPVPGHHLSEAEIVRMIFHTLVDEASSVYAIEQAFNEQRVPTYARCRGLTEGAERWVHATLQSIVKNPIYKGVMVYGKRTDHEIIAEVPALVSPQVWGAARQQLTLNKKQSSRNAKQAYALSGLVRCGACGCGYIGFCHRRRWRYYSCAARITPLRYPDHAPCRSPNLNADQVEAAIWSDIERFVQHPDEALEALVADLTQHRDQADGLQDEIDRLTSLIKNLEGSRQRVLQLFVKGQIDDQQRDILLCEVDAEEATFQAARAEKLAVLAACQQQEQQVTTARSLLTQMQGRLAVATPEERQAVLRQAVKSVVVHTDHLEVRYVYSPLLPVSDEDIVAAPNGLYDDAARTARPLRSDPPPAPGRCGDAARLLAAHRCRRAPPRLGEGAGVSRRIEHGDTEAHRGPRRFLDRISRSDRTD